MNLRLEKAIAHYLGNGAMLIMAAIKKHPEWGLTEEDFEAVNQVLCRVREAGRKQRQEKSCREKDQKRPIL